jgi:hypothetical protein
MSVACEAEEVELEGDFGPVGGVCARCRRCGHETESFGTSEASVRRCLVRMREECPRRQLNYYTAADDEPPPRRPGPPRVAVLTCEQLAAVFRDLARRHHPDAGGGEEAMKAINDAHEQLRRLLEARNDPNRRTDRR